MAEKLGFCYNREKEQTKEEKMINGNQVSGTIVLLIYDICILLFLLSMVAYYRKNQGQSGSKRQDRFLRLKRITDYYFKHGIFSMMGLFIGIIAIMALFLQVGTLLDVIRISLSCLLFSSFIFIIQKIFIRTKNFKNVNVTQMIDMIFYIILGNTVCHYMSFITTPNLYLSIGGLCVALLLCFSVMLRAIITPEILIRKVALGRKEYRDALGLIQGMLVLMGMVIFTLFLMVLACYQTNPDFYYVTFQTPLDSFDLFYYTVISLSTIGYGDIVPAIVDYSRISYFVAVLIALSGMFMTGCFVGAVISGTNNIKKEEA